MTKIDAFSCFPRDGGVELKLNILQENWFWHACYKLIIIFCYCWNGTHAHTKTGDWNVSIIRKVCLGSRLPNENRWWKLSGSKKKQEICSFIVDIQSPENFQFCIQPQHNPSPLFNSLLSYSLYFVFSRQNLKTMHCTRESEEKRIKCSRASKKLDTCSGLIEKWYWMAYKGVKCMKSTHFLVSDYSRLWVQVKYLKRAK